MANEEISEKIKLRNFKRAALGLSEEYEFEYNNAKHHCVIDRVLLTGSLTVSQLPLNKGSNKSQIENMGELYLYCNELEGLDQSGFDALKV